MRRSMPSRSTELERRTPLERTPAPQRRKPLNRVSARKRAVLVHAVKTTARPRRPAREQGGFSRRARLLMFRRFDGRCVCCRRPLPPKWWQAQHRRARQSGGTSDPVAAYVSNGIAMLPGCHDYVEHHPTWALLMGYRIPQGSDPLAEPLTLWDGTRVLLTNAGAYAPVQTDEEST